MTKTLEIHVIQTYPASRMNRGEDGSPKSIVMGGVTRARVSSQSIKRAQRTQSPSDIPAIRTKKPHELVARELENVTTDVSAILMDVMTQQYGGYDDTGRLKVLAQLGHDEVQRFAAVIQPALADLLERRVQLDAQRQAVAAAKENKDKAVKALEETQKNMQQEYDTLITTVLGNMQPKTESADIAMFGRFMAEDRAWNIEAATSYAHAIGVGRAAVTADFFTAVDDVDGTVGHIGNTDHVAPTLYRMATLDIEQLRRNLGRQEVGDVVQAWVRGFLYATPTGGQHGAFARTLPEYVMLTARIGGMPITYANAFAEPVYPADGKTLVSQSVGRLREFAAKQAELYGDNGQFQTFELTTLSGLDVPSVPLDKATAEALKLLEV